MSLTATAVDRAKPRDKSYKVFDSGGLFLLVAPSGGKWWRFKYRFNNKEKLLSLGVYPEVSLKTARERRDLERKKLADNIDPATNRRAARAAWVDSQANTFEVVAREWIESQSSIWSQRNTRKVTRNLENNIFPWLGSRPIADIHAPELLSTLRRTEARGACYTAHSLLQTCGQIFRYAIATGRAMRDISADLKGALKPVKGNHYAAITDPKDIGPLLRMLHSYKGTFVVRCALRLAPLVFVRPSELRKAEWKEIDFEKAEWNIPAERVKMQRQPHLVPLSKQALEILQELQPLTGRSRYVFPSPRGTGKPMSDNTILGALRRMDIPKEEMTGHGFRAMARTVLDEVLYERPDFIEHQLAHAVRDPNGRAYNRTSHLSARHQMMQNWADYLDGLRAS